MSWPVLALALRPRRGHAAAEANNNNNNSSSTLAAKEAARAVVNNDKAAKAVLKQEANMGKEAAKSAKAADKEVLSERSQQRVSLTEEVARSARSGRTNVDAELLVQTDTFMFATSSLRLLEVTSSAAAIIRGRGTTTVLTVRQPREVRK